MVVKIIMNILLANGEKVVRNIAIKPRFEDGKIAELKNQMNDVLSLGVWVDGIPTEDNPFPIPTKFISPNQIIGFEFSEQITKPEVKPEPKKIEIPVIKKPTFLSKKKDKNKK